MTDTGSVHLEGMAHGGEAIGHLDDGRVVFVDGGLPDETVPVQVREDHDRYARAVLAGLPITSSSDRVLNPSCPHFGSWPSRGLEPSGHCGGCQWQHVEYAAQLRYKSSVLTDVLERIGRIAAPTVAETAGMENPWHYRNRLRVAVGSEGLGFRAHDGVSICAISTCPIGHPAVVALLDEFDGPLPEGIEIDLRAGLGTGDRLVALHGPADVVDSVEIECRSEVSVVVVEPDGATQVAAGRPYLYERLGGRDFIVPAVSFFQVNTSMAAVLLDRVRSVLPDEIDVLADVHSGVGTFAILLADRAREVFAIESDPVSVGAAVENAAGLSNVTLLEAGADEGLSYLDRPADTIILDPPRTGLDRKTVGLLLEYPASTICYVSCEPSTLARDSLQLAAGGWQLVQSWPVDMFPQTYHIESVNLFRRAQSRD